MTFRAVVDSVSAVRDARVCPHLDKGINLEKVLVKIALSETHQCDDCREGVIDKRAGKGKHSKKKGGGSASDSKSIWLNLQKRTGNKKMFYLKLLVLKAQRPSNNSLDVESVYFGSGSVLSESTSSNKNSLSGSDTSGVHKVKGLLNLGNTCFLNSALQNLLAIDRLRDRYLKMENGGPLSDSLKNFFVEANPLASGKHVVNPRPLFNSICAIASQFKGYQQQDSHKVLRFLLDGLSSEETGIQKCVPKNSPTFVDVSS
ncbi:ubiquitin-specific protease 2 [Artemisia annua]|uniref:Ubiquitin-specific protease 2 n=1 Tax=Artemisia annua TaxID=35608 RepID=A0A2U1PVK7_ARTAN|nr:ubiquitin-specific protease 2 [Artemisia annua]